MQYKVYNSICDMKLLRNGSLFVIKKDTVSEVSADEYQYLAQVYGMSLKGDKVIEVRTTKPVKVETVVEEQKKQRKRKKVSAK